MPEKRAETAEKVDATKMMPDIYENWLEKQKSTHVHAKTGFISEWKEAQEVSGEERIEIGAATGEKAKRRKKGKMTH